MAKKLITRFAHHNTLLYRGRPSATAFSYLTIFKGSANCYTRIHIRIGLGLLQFFAVHFCGPCQRCVVVLRLHHAREPRAVLLQFTEPCQHVNVANTSTETPHRRQPACWRLERKRDPNRLSSERRPHGPPVPSH